MDPPERQDSVARAVWALGRKQHRLITRSQLLELGVRRDAVRHRLKTGRLHRIRPGVYALGSPELTRAGHWMAAVLYLAPEAYLSHTSAAELWGISGHPDRVSRPIHVSLARDVSRRAPGIRTHRPSSLRSGDRALRDRIPVTSPTRTLIDLATVLSPGRLERAVNEADRLDLVDPETLRAAVERRKGVRGRPSLLRLLDRRTFVLTDSELERRFLAVVRRAGLPEPITGVHLNGFKVDFFWPGLRLVVETDGLRYHRTPTQQARDRERDQAHARAGLTPLRFTYAQVRYEPEGVVGTLRAVVERLRRLAA
jgi:very-short-patch-repair endonuclease